MRKLAPYQIFFPIGVLCSALAVGVWLVQNLGWFDAPAMLIHSKLIIGGFLWSFIVGFLMTAIPKMTGTASAKRGEVAIAVLLIALQIVFSWFVDGRPFYLGQMLVVLFVMVFAGRRVLKRTRALPVFFSHMVLAMVLALGGAAALFQGERMMGIHLFHVGTILLLILGIGTRFFSFLSGLPSEFEGMPLRRQWVFHLLGLLVAAQLVLAGAGVRAAYLGLFVTTLLYLLLVWKVLRRSERTSSLKAAVRIVAFMIPLSFLLCWIEPAQFLTWLHLLFIGCFGMMTYAVATRVTLAHGAYSTDLEIRSRSLWVFVAMLSLSAVARMLYGVVDEPVKAHLLHVAAMFWLLAVGCWCYSFARRIIVPGDQVQAC